MAADDDRPIASHPEELTSTDRGPSTNRIVYALYAICALLVVIDPFIHKHGKFEIEHVWGFYAIFGLVGCLSMVFAAKLMRFALKRREDYYDE